MEQTLIILKPDAIQRAYIGEIITRFERAGLKIVAMKMLSPSKELYHQHYEEIGKVISRRGQEVFDDNLEFMQSGPVVAAILEGVEAVSLVRKMVGSTEPKSSVPGTIRGDYAHMSYDHANTERVGIPNLIHASGDPEEAKMEIALWFSIGEIFEYETLHEAYLNATKQKQHQAQRQKKKKNKS